MLSCPFLGENSRSALEGEVPGVNNAVLREVAAGSFSIFPPNSFFFSLWAFNTKCLQLQDCFLVL